MESLQLGGSVCRVILLDKDSSGNVEPVVLFERPPKKRRVSAAFRPVERAARRWADAQSAIATTYLDLHNQSNEEKADGWIRDLPLNVIKATRSGAKKLKLPRLLTP